MLFLPPGTSKLQRLHGAVRLGERGRASSSTFLREQGAPQLRRDADAAARGERGAGGAAARTSTSSTTARSRSSRETRNASISYIQRRLKVGYNRAARMIEQMEHEGVVGPQDGTKPREVFVRAARAPNRGPHARAVAVGMRAASPRSRLARRARRGAPPPARRRGRRTPDCGARRRRAACRRATTGSATSRALRADEPHARRARRAPARPRRRAGAVEFAKPGKMRWSYEAPEPSLVVSDGETLWIYDPTRDEVAEAAGRRGLPLGGRGPVPARRRASMRRRLRGDARRRATRPRRSSSSCRARRAPTSARACASTRKTGGVRETTRLRPARQRDARRVPRAARRTRAPDASRFRFEAARRRAGDRARAEPRPRPPTTAAIGRGASQDRKSRFPLRSPRKSPHSSAG